MPDSDPTQKTMSHELFAEFLACILPNNVCFTPHEVLQCSAVVDKSL